MLRIKFINSFFYLFAFITIFLGIGEIGGIIVLIYLHFYALKGPDEVIKSLTISFLIFLLNPAIFSLDSTTISLFRTTLLIVSFIPTLYFSLKKNGYNLLVLSNVILIISILITSLINSYNLGVSLFKLFLFMISTLNVLLCFRNSNKGIDFWLNWFYSFLIFIIVFSIPFLFIPSIGYFRNGQGFQGIVNHPQTFGPFCIYLSTILIAELIENGKLSIGKIFLLLGSFTMVYLSSARTSVISLLLGLIIVMIYNSFKFKNYIAFFKLIFKPMNVIVIVVFSLIVALNFTSISTGFKDYVFKRESKDLSESFQNSRGFLILKQIDNFQKAPYTGIGFQLSSIKKKMEVKYDPYFNLPIQATIEKGNMFTGVIEENGIFGGFFFIIFIVSLLKNAFRFKIVVPLLVTTALMMNIGEAIFFSFGGGGLFMWLMFGLSLSKRYNY